MVDADKSNGNVTQTKIIAESYRNLRAALSTRATSSAWLEQNCPILRTDLELMEPAPWNPLKVREGEREIDCKQLQEFLQLSPEENATPAEKLLRILYTPSQLDANLEEGFLGRPSIGAAVFALTLERKGLGPWEEVFRKAADQADDRFFLFGSVFGGTGAAGMPTLPKLLRDFLNEENRGKQQSYFGGALLLPYFEFEDRKSGNRDLYAHPGEFLANTRAALIHYAENFRKYYDRLYILGEKPGRMLKGYQPGGSEQKNLPHYVELLAASAALQFLCPPGSSSSKGDGRPSDAGRVEPLVIGARNIPEDEPPASGASGTPAEGKESFECADLPWLITKDGQPANDAAEVQTKLGVFTRMCLAYTGMHHAKLQSLFEGKASARIPWIIDLGIASNQKGVYDHFQMLCAGYRDWMTALHDADHGLTLSLINRKAVGEGAVGKFVVGNDALQAKKLADVWRLMCADREHAVVGSPFAGFLLKLYHACG